MAVGTDLRLTAFRLPTISWKHLKIPSQKKEMIRGTAIATLTTSRTRLRQATPRWEVSEYKQLQLGNVLEVPYRDTLEHLRCPRATYQLHIRR